MCQIPCTLVKSNWILRIISKSISKTIVFSNSSHCGRPENRGWTKLLRRYDFWLQVLLHLSMCSHRLVAEGVAAIVHFYQSVPWQSKRFLCMSLYLAGAPKTWLMILRRSLGQIKIWGNEESSKWHRHISPSTRTYWIQFVFGLQICFLRRIQLTIDAKWYQHLRTLCLIV